MKHPSYEKYSYFELFELAAAPQMDLAELESAYLTLQSKTHPDRYQNPQQRKIAQSLSDVINIAYKTLADELQRRIYLLQLHGIYISDKESNFKLSASILENIYNFRSQIDESEDIETLAEFKEYASKQYQTLLTNFDKLFLAEDYLSSGHELSHALFYSKILKDLNLKLNELNANT